MDMCYYPTQFGDNAGTVIWVISINNRKITFDGVEWFSENLLYENHEETGNDCRKINCSRALDINPKLKGMRDPRSRKTATTSKNSECFGILIHLLLLPSP